MKLLVMQTCFIIGAGTLISDGSKTKLQEIDETFLLSIDVVRSFDV
jgi:hypothetical protein